MFAGAEVHPVSAFHASSGPGEDLPGSQPFGWVVPPLWDEPNLQFDWISCGFELCLCSPSAVNLLKRMLVLDCDGRISASEALAHPYFSQYHDPEDEPDAPPYDQTLESKDRTLEEWKGKTLVWNFNFRSDKLTNSVFLQRRKSFFLTK